MPYYRFLWNDENTDHLAQHGITPGEFESVVNDPDERDVSWSTGLPAAFGYTEDGRYVIAVYELLDEWTVIPVTAYEIQEP
jgi:hypothetical protein